MHPPVDNYGEKMRILCFTFSNVCFTLYYFLFAVNLLFPFISTVDLYCFCKGKGMNDVGLMHFENISLDKMSGIRLMRRIDKKFVFPAGSLQEILAALEQDYFVQEIGGKHLSPYSTIYYDTPDYKMYCAHQNGKLNRLKVRTREYVDSDLCFLEVKKKSNKGITQKIRIASRPDEIRGSEAAFLSSHIPYDPMGLEAKLCSRYNRITLVNKAKTERVTIDLDLCFLMRSPNEPCLCPKWR